MPLYDYQCAKCGAVFEVRQKFSDEPLTHHEGCGGDVTKLISAPAFQFKGSGWYITDYARSGGAKSESKSESGSESKSESKSESSSSSSSDSKPSSTPASSTTKSE